MYFVSLHLRRCLLWAIVLLGCGALPLMAQQSLTPANASDKQNNQKDLSDAQLLLSQQQAAFIANKGQLTDSEGKSRTDVRYIANVGNMSVYFMADRICYVLTDPKAMEKMHSQKPHDISYEQTTTSEQEQVAVFRFDMKLLNAKKEVGIHGEGKSTGSYTYYASETAVQSEAYQKVVYSNVYDGIDLVYYVTDKGLKYDFIVHPGGDYRAIAWQYEGADAVSLTKQGTMQIKTSLGTIEENIPLTYEVSTAGKRTEIAGARFVLEGTTCRFQIDGTHPEQTLVIDPSIVWATYYGSTSSSTSSTDECTSVASDNSNNVIVVGWTASNVFPVYLGYQMASGGNNDAFVVKFNSAGTRLWATYYGGNSDDRAYSVAIGANDSIYVVGLTSSTNLLVPYAFQASNGGGYDAFIAEFTPSGSLYWGSYCGGSSNDYGSDVAISTTGNVPAFTGTTYSTNFPTSRALITSLNQTGSGAESDAFVVTAYKGTQYFGSYFGGDGDDRGQGIIIDGSNYVTFTGYTTNFTNYSYPLAFTSPMTNAWQTTYGGGVSDAFLTKIYVPNYGAVSWNWSTYFGSRREDVAEDIAMIVSGSTIAITGSSMSYVLAPSTCVKNADTNAFDAFVYVFDYNFGTPTTGRFFGGTSNDYGMDIARIGTTVEEILIAGYTTSSNMPLQEPFQSTMGVNEAFVARLDHGACQLKWSTYYGTTGSSEYAYGVCSDGLERSIIVGRAEYTGLTLRSSTMGWQNGADGFVAVFDESCGRFPTFFGGTKDEHAEDVAVDNSGNIYITGWTKSSNLPATVGAHQTSLSGTQDAFVAKFDAMGNRVWATYYGGSASETGTGITTDGSSVYMVGYTTSTNNIATAGTWLPVCSGLNANGFLVKFNSSGVRQWGTYIGGLEADYATAVALDNSGYIVVTGYTRTDFPDTVFASAGAPQLYFGGGAFDAFVSKFNSSGGRVWSTFAGGTGDDRGYGICIENGNRIIMVGGTSDGSAYPRYGGATSFVGTNWDAIVTKYYSNGSSPWSMVYGGNDNDTAFAVAAQTSGTYGRVYVTGTTQNTGSQTFPVSPGSYASTNNNDIFVIRLDSVGTRWRARVVDNSNGDDHADAIVAYSDGVMVTGQTASTTLVSGGVIPGTPIQSSLSGTTDGVILAMDQYFTYTGGTYFGGTGNEAATGIAVDSRQRVVICGWSSSSTFGSLYDNYWAYQTSRAGGEDAFIARFTLNLSKVAKQGDGDFLPITGKTENLYRCYPNPTSGLMTLEGEVETGTPLVFTVTDVLGRVVFTFEDKPADAHYSRTIDVSQLTTGTYLMTIHSGTAPATGMTFIKQ